MLASPRILTIETAMEWIDGDELVEVTPDAIRACMKVLACNKTRAPRRRQEPLMSLALLLSDTAVSAVAAVYALSVRPRRAKARTRAGSLVDDATSSVFQEPRAFPFWIRDAVSWRANECLLEGALVFSESVEPVGALFVGAGAEARLER